jgi:hypothetical protein
VVSRNSFSFEPMLCQKAEPLPEGRDYIQLQRAFLAARHS